LLRRVLVPTGMSIWTVAGDMRDFLRLATDAIIDDDEEGEEGEEGRRGPCGRDDEGGNEKEKERERRCLLLEAVTVC
jgi:hypothetical protein